MKYSNLIHNLSLLQNGIIHERVLKSVEEFIQAGLAEIKAISMAVKNNQHMLEYIWNLVDSDDSKVDDNNDEDLQLGATDSEDYQLQDNTQFKIENILKTKGLYSR